MTDGLLGSRTHALHLGTTEGTWVDQGPGPAQNGLVENITPTNEVAGALHTVVAHPTDGNRLWVGGVNGGVWRTTNATAASPTWVPLTDNFPSLSIGALELDPTDATTQTLVAGIGRFSSYAGIGGRLTGLLRSTDGGTTWTQVGETALAGRNISGIGPRGNTILVASDFGIQRTTDGGATFQNLSGMNGLPNGRVFDLVGDPGNQSRFYAAVGGAGSAIMRTDDAGDNWTNVNDAAITALLGAATNNVELAVHNNAAMGTNAVYVGIVNDTDPDPSRTRNQLVGVFRSPDQGANWAAMDLPQTNEGGTTVGIHPGGQGSIHFSIAADSTDANIVYVGGDRQQGPFPNSIRANRFVGRLFRGNASVAPTGAVPSPQWEHLTHATPGGGTANSSAPHADSREMAIDANGDLIEVDDGGVYRRTQPRSSMGDWFSINGNVQPAEVYDAAYDTVFNLVLAGIQDNGVTEQTATGSHTWNSVHLGDGGDVAVDATSMAGQSIRYSSGQCLGEFQRRVCSAATVCVSTPIALTPAAGSNPLVAQFVTPIELNAIDPARMLLLAGNSLYESTDRGDTVTELIATGGATTCQAFIRSVNGMAYGGRRGGTDNPDVAYVPVGLNVQVRTTAGGAFSAAGALPRGNSGVVDIVLDPDDWMIAYAIDPDQVFRTTDGGANWEEITGNIRQEGAASFQAIEYVRGAVHDRIVVGTSAGVYVSAEGSLGSWFRLGGGLPNAPVYDLDYDATDDVLVAGTLGRGTWSLGNVSTLNLPPVARCRDVTTPTDPGVCRAANVSIDNGSFDPDGMLITLAQNPPGPYGRGATNITLTCTDPAGLADSCTGVITVVDQEPPRIQCPADLVLECVGGGAVATYSATASDNCDPVAAQCVPPSGSRFPKGISPVVCSASDTAGNASSCGFNVHVVDTQGPVVTTRPDAIVLWPPNHSYRGFSLADCVTSVVDRCDGTLDVRTRGQITAIVSDEPEDAHGDGSTCNDMLIMSNHEARLRAERRGNGDGRVYTIRFTVSDLTGNQTAASCRLIVPHSGPTSVATDSGSAWCVGGGCGGLPGHDPACRD